MTIPEVGDKAPGFSLPNEEGQTIRLSDFKGRPLVLFFYPKDDTPGCTKEACNFRDDFEDFQRAGIEILGVSPDPPDSHARFKEKYELPFSLLADETNEICEAYGVWGRKKFRGREYMGVNRTTFVIDGDGAISHVFENVDPTGHSQEVLAALQTV